MAEQYEVTADFLLSKTKYRPQIGIICGSGLGGLSACLEKSVSFKYEDIPGFPHSTVAGHAGELVFGLIGGIQCVCMKGRFHFYEGHSMQDTVLAVRVMRLMGAKMVIVTNAAGGLNPNFNVGDIVCIQDHFGLPTLAGTHPLIGPNDNNLGPRFPAMSDAYDPVLQEMVMSASESLGLAQYFRKNGVYTFVSGPCYETPTECRFLRSVGGDCVGMSTIPEVIAAKHCGMKVLLMSLCTNIVVSDSTAKNVVHASHAEVLEAVEVAGKRMESIVKHIVSKDILGPYLEAQPKATYKRSGLPAAPGVKTTAGAVATAGGCSCGKPGCTCVGPCGADCKCCSSGPSCCSSGAGASCCPTSSSSVSTPSCCAPKKATTCKCPSTGVCAGKCGDKCFCPPPGLSGRGCRCSADCKCSGSCGAHCECLKKVNFVRLFFISVAVVTAGSFLLQRLKK